jgi:DMSO/TMAO reductase YedYZ molybdopterin-dependent catalytic subunit
VSTTAVPEQSIRPPRSGIPVGFAALIGLLAVGAALGVGHLAAALVSPASSPFLAVGDTVIRFSPQTLTEFAKSAFGTNDKPVLLAGMAVVIAAVAALAGVASRRSRTPGVVVVVVLGVLGLLAVATAPVYAPLDLLAPLVALAVGFGVFTFLHRRALLAHDAPAPAGDDAAQVSRRNVLIGSSAAIGVGALAAGGAGFALGGDLGDSRRAVAGRLGAANLAEAAPPIPPGADFVQAGTPSFITPNPEFYRVDVALRIPSQAAADWSMRIHGMVDNEMMLTFDDLLARPLVERTITMTCVSNEVGGRYLSTANFVGVELRDILLEAGVRPGADQVVTTSLDRWTAGTPTDVLLEPDRGALLAIGMNGEPLPPEHGFPVRMVVPGLYGYISATKWLADMEVTTFDARSTYWRQRGWGKFGPIKTQSRIDAPRAFGKVPAGPVTVAGIAWSQPVGIERVEVRMDGGPWRAAELSTEVNYDTWRMWKIDFDLAPGSHTAQVRATDRNGDTQTEMRAEPIPDGATGWHSTLFTVT